MAKSRPKKASQHSRASRRATSPSINTDKSLKNVKPPLPAGANIIHKHSSDVGASASTGAGVSKRSKKQRKTRDQRLRLEKAVLRAEAVMDQMGKKLAVSRRRGRTGKDRSGAWEEINGKIRKVKRKQYEPLPTTDDDEGWETGDEGNEDQVLEGLDKMTVHDLLVPEIPIALNESEDKVL